MTTKSECDYRSFSNHSHGGQMLTNDEIRLRRERIAWQKAHPKPWFLSAVKPIWKKGKKDDNED